MIVFTRPGILLLLSLLLFTMRVEGISINSSVALTPFKGQKIIRVQGKYTRKSDDPSVMNRDIRILMLPATLVYGFTEKFSGFVVAPFIGKKLHTTLPVGRVKRSSSGVGDITLLGKYRVWKLDKRGKTTRAALLGGLKLPTGRSNISDSLGSLPRPLQPGSGSWDPIIGAVVTRQTLDDEWDLSSTYKINTNHRGYRFGNLLKYTVAYQKRILPHELPEKGLYRQVNAVLELNGEWATKDRTGGTSVANSGGHTIYLSPGMQWVSKRMILEFSVQVPIIQYLNGAQVEADYTAVLSARRTF